MNGIAPVTVLSAVEVDGDEVRLNRVAVTDPPLAGLLRAHPEEEWEAISARALAVGARGLLTMGLGVDLAEVDTRVRRAFEEVTADARRGVERLLESGREALTEQFDPGLRTSLLGRAIRDFHEWRDRLLDGLDPDLAGSHASRFIDEVNGLLGPEGLLERRLTEALDPDTDGSGLARLAAAMEERFDRLAALVAREQGRQEESQRGTAKGNEFEDVVEVTLRRVAAGFGGCTVERTSRLPGMLGADVMVGDFVVTLPGGQRIVVEAKNQASLTLHGPTGILAELERAIDNRSAGFAVCVSALPAFPAEVGPLGLYGNRMLVVDAGDGTLAEAALRWARAVVETSDTGDDRVDVAALGDLFERLRALAKHFSTQKRALTDVRRSIEGVQDGLHELRTSLVELVEEGLRRLRAAGVSAD